MREVDLEAIKMRVYVSHAAAAAFSDCVRRDRIAKTAEWVSGALKRWARAQEVEPTLHCPPLTCELPLQVYPDALGELFALGNKNTLQACIDAALRHAAQQEHRPASTSPYAHTYVSITWISNVDKRHVFDTLAKRMGVSRSAFLNSIALDETLTIPTGPRAPPTFPIVAPNNVSSSVRITLAAVERAKALGAKHDLSVSGALNALVDQKLLSVLAEEEPMLFSQYDEMDVVEFEDTFIPGFHDRV